MAYEIHVDVPNLFPVPGCTNCPIRISGVKDIFTSRLPYGRILRFNRISTHCRFVEQKVEMRQSFEQIIKLNSRPTSQFTVGGSTRRWKSVECPELARSHKPLVML